MDEKKCTKFEELFIKEDESELLEHINNCPQCMAEYKKKKKGQLYIRKRNMSGGCGRRWNIRMPPG